mmetsp:Transcript_8141/g.16203  ORF Transcript_8141/g.16203 Transcript_8141/m.16203 type:complete len:205 (-) Transcript_8141:439-1053(-)
MSQLTNLEYLDVSGNSLCGSQPDLSFVDELTGMPPSTSLSDCASSTPRPTNYWQTSSASPTSKPTTSSVDADHGSYYNNDDDDHMSTSSMIGAVVAVVVVVGLIFGICLLCRLGCCGCCRRQEPEQEDVTKLPTAIPNHTSSYAHGSPPEVGIMMSTIPTATPTHETVFPTPATSSQLVFAEVVYNDEDNQHLGQQNNQAVTRL